MSDRYTIISADSHAGGNMSMYEQYLPSEWKDAFDEWRGAYSNPYRDLQDDGRTRNWDNERRVSEQYADGVVAEITFPNTVPPFYPTGSLIAMAPKNAEDFRRRKAGIDCHNRWLKDWCDEYPGQRCGLPQIFLDDLDDAVRTLEWAAAEGFKSFLLPHVAPDVDLPGLWSPAWDRLWATVQHGGNGTPDYGKDPASGVIFLMEVPFFAHRNLAHLTMSGVFQRFPNLKYVMTEQGVAWAIEELRRMDAYHAQMKHGRVGELGFSADIVLDLKPSEYFDRNVWIGASFPSPGEAEAIRHLGTHKVMWGSDYPHHEGTYPYSVKSLQRAFHDWSEDDLRKVLSENAADVYGFDLDVLAPLAAEHGPTVGEVAQPLAEIPKDATSPAFFKR
jgi:predicted TIM-barrel fold metal-dependent hydrolase